jgi:hypothetical protein
LFIIPIFIALSLKCGGLSPGLRLCRCEKEPAEELRHLQLRLRLYCDGEPRAD